MAWSTEWAEQVPQLLKFQEESGIIPPALQIRPVLTDVQYWYYSQFMELSRDRRYVDSGPLPLTTAEIRIFWNSFIQLDFQGFRDYMVTLDRAWLDAVTAKRKKTAVKPETKTTVAPRKRQKR